MSPYFSYTYIYIYMCMYIFICVLHTCVLFTYIHALYTHILIHTHAHTHIHIHNRNGVAGGQFVHFCLFHLRLVGHVGVSRRISAQYRNERTRCHCFLAGLRSIEITQRVMLACVRAFACVPYIQCAVLFLRPHIFHEDKVYV